MAQLLIISKHFNHLNYVNLYGQWVDKNTTIVLHDPYYKATRNNIVPINLMEAKIRIAFPNNPILVVKAIRNSYNWATSITEAYFLNGGSDNIDKIYFDNEYLFNRFNEGIGDNPIAKLISIDYYFQTEVANSKLGTTIMDDQFINGVIHANTKKYPAVIPTVDVGIVFESDPHHLNSIIVGKKKGDNFYHFIGGFVDPTDKSYESAACREAFEETNIIITRDELEYLGSRRINDWRYGDQTDKIITHLYCVKYNETQSELIRRYMVAKDDILELIEFPLLASEEHKITPLHRKLFKTICHKYGKVDMDEEYDPEDLTPTR